MPRLFLNVTIDRSCHKIAIKRSWVRNVVVNLIGYLKLEPPIEIDILITGNKIIRELNKRFREIDRATDVLSFYMITEDGEEQRNQFVIAPDGIKHLGEIIISCEQASKQALKNQVSMQHEIAVLLIHGILHLLGYDHAKKKDREKMQRKERFLLSKIQTLIF